MSSGKKEEKKKRERRKFTIQRRLACPRKDQQRKAMAMITDAGALTGKGR